LKFEFEELTIQNAGKYFPLKEKFRAVPADPEEAARVAEELYLEQNTPETQALADATADLLEDTSSHEET
jgi:hypothetical protein